MADAPPQTEFTSPEDRLIYLALRYFDGDLDDAELAELNHRLREDPEQRQRFVRYCVRSRLIAETFEPERQATLRHEDDAPSALTHLQWLGADAPAALPGSPRSGWRRVAGRLAAAAVILLAVGVSAALLVQAHRARQQATSVLAGEAVAVITQVEGAVWQNAAYRDLQVGSSLGAGVLGLVAGQVHVQFYCGATVMLEGPVEFQIHSDQRGFLVHGKMAARVPEEAIGFTVGTPGVAVVDLGTEFAVNVSRAGVSEIHVFDGEVEASLLDEDGSAVVSELMETAETVKIDARRAEVTRVEPGSDRFVRVAPLKERGLPVTAAYVRTIEKARPLAYWRFEQIENGHVQNHVSAAHSAMVVGEVELTDHALNRSAVLRRDANGQCLVVADRFEGFNQGDYTVEMWLNPAAVRQSAVATFRRTTDVTDKKGRPRHDRLAVVDLMSQNKKYVNAGGVLRFMHRKQATGKMTRYFAYTKATYTPGRWHHVVAVKKGKQLSIYLNGKLHRRVKDETRPDDEAYQMVIGRLLPDKSQRQFVGQLDEVAVYDRALSDQEIRRHHQLVGTSTAKTPSPN
ncbi:MAG: LamG domain-containing protein [Phycisphaerae bacterium]|nr:LamG domain-containing protein [Phycisphaerae bacterium]